VSFIHAASFLFIICERMFFYQYKYYGMDGKYYSSSFHFCENKKTAPME